MKILRTDRELETPWLDAELRKRGELVLLADGIAETDFAAEAAQADLILMCYTPVTARVIGAAPQARASSKSSPRRNGARLPGVANTRP